MRISNNSAIQQAQLAGDLATATQSAEDTGDGFAAQLMDVINSLNDSQAKVAGMREDLITNRRQVDIHDMMIASEMASTQMQLVMAVRNKVLEGYQEISRMQV